MKILQKITGKKKIRKAKVLEIGYLVDASHTYIITLAEDGKGEKIKIGFTDDAEASAYAIGYCCRLQELAKGKYAICLNLDRSMINYLAMTNKKEENIQKILKTRNEGEKKAEQDIKPYL